MLVEHTEEMIKGQAERLLPLLQETVSEADIGFNDLTAIACGVGPGNFTGVRISVSTARGFALALGIPAIGVSSLEALAHDLPRPALSLVDAKRDYIYAQGFGTGPDAPVRLPFQRLAGQAFPPSLNIAGHRATEFPGLHRTEALPSATAIAQIALTRLCKANPAPAPLYLREADAAPPSDPPPKILNDT